MKKQKVMGLRESKGKRGQPRGREELKREKEERDIGGRGDYEEDWHIKSITCLMCDQR